MLGIVIGALAIAYFFTDELGNYFKCDSKCNKCLQFDCPYRYRK